MKIKNLNCDLINIVDDYNVELHYKREASNRWYYKYGITWVIVNFYDELESLFQAYNK